MAGIKAITFDLDGVYFPNGKHNFIKAVCKLGVPEAEVARVFLKSDEMNKEYKTGRMTDDEYWSWAADQWGIDLMPKQLIDLLIASYDVDPKVVDVVRKLRKNGYKTLICSNNFPARVNGLQKKFGFLDDFDAVVLSYEVGVLKPARMIFEELVRKAGVPAESIVFSDDNENNLRGAQQLGIKTFFYKGFDEFMQELRKLGVKI